MNSRMVFKSREESEQYHREYEAEVERLYKEYRLDPEDPSNKGFTEEIINLHNNAVRRLAEEKASEILFNREMQGRPSEDFDFGAYLENK